MAGQTLTEILAELLHLHERLNQLAMEKAEAVKKNEIAVLNNIIRQETSLIKKLAKAEQSRIYAVQDFVQAKGVAIENATMEWVIEHSPEAEQPRLKEQLQLLLQEVTRLKQLNELNKMLIEDSLRFVELSLDLLSPDIADMNYERPTTKEANPVEQRSIFDSRA